MNPIKKHLKSSRFVLFLRVLHEKWLEVIPYTKHLADGQYNDKIKARADLTIRVHAIEKGMSIGKVKVGFGQKKVKELISDLLHFNKIGGSPAFINEAYSVLLKYVDFNESLGANMKDIKELLKTSAKTLNISELNATCGGIYTLKHEDVKAHAAEDFSMFSQWRYSVRDFSDKPLDLEKLKEAFELARRTPSACNRQSWRVHVFTDATKRNKLFELQGGCNGFYQDMQAAILICGDLNCYKLNELELAFVDGGIYAMNLLYALNYKDIASIPLTMGRKQKDLAALKRIMGIPENEVPVLLIGIGTYKDEFKVAVSSRHHFDDYIFYN